MIHEHDSFYIGYTTNPPLWNRHLTFGHDDNSWYIDLSGRFKSRPLRDPGDLSGSRDFAGQTAFVRLVSTTIFFMSFDYGFLDSFLHQTWHGLQSTDNDLVRRHGTLGNMTTKGVSDQSIDSDKPGLVLTLAMTAHLPLLNTAAL
jgi:hypothetical protein